MVACNADEINGLPVGIPAAIIAFSPCCESHDFRIGGFEDMIQYYDGNFDEIIDLLGVPDNAGIWVYEQDSFSDATEDEDDWSHLSHGWWRRPTIDEAMTFCGGESPWKQGTLF